MKIIALLQIDAFTKEVFKGNLSLKWRFFSISRPLTAVILYP